jgi:HK97 family phage major capsid protein
MKSIAEQIASFEAKRQASMGRMNDIMSAAADEGRTLDDPETQEYDGLKTEIKAVDDHLVRLKAHEVQMVATAAKVTPEVGADPNAATQSRDNGTTSIVNVKPNIEKGIAFTRYVKAICMARGSLTGALAIAQNNRQWQDQTPQVAKVLMAAVAAGDTTTSGWASELVYNQNLASEFIELLRPMTILGKLTGLTRVPFNVRMSGQDSGSTAYWVGQGKPIPVSKLNTLEVTLGIAKAAGLVVLTEELVRSSEPSAEMLVRNDIAKAIASFLDVQFIAPDYAAVTNVSPASITNGVTPTAATGTTSAALRTDVQTLFGIWIAANVDPSGGAWIMTPTSALAISLMLNALGQPVFPEITMNGGRFFGLPVIVSQAAKQVGSPIAGEGNLIVLVNQPDILLADDGQVTIDASREASLEMLDNPTNQSVPTVTATSMVSMYQTNSVAIKGVRFINWKKRRSTAVAYIKDAAYVT